MPPGPSAASTSGRRRYYTSQASAAQVTAIIAAAELAILAALASLVLKVLAGTLLANLAARRFRSAVLAIITQAEQDLRPVLAAMSAAARADVQDILTADLGPLARLLPAIPSASLPRLSASLRSALQKAAAEADAAFRDIVRSGSPLDAQQMLDDLAGTGLAGLTDRAGRNWNITTYAEMASRTAAEQAHLNLQVQAFRDAGIDLIYVARSSSLPPCGRCAPYVHRILSVSGLSAGTVLAGGRSVQVAGTLTQARAAGLYHPQCRDSAVPVTGSFAAPPSDAHSDAWLAAMQGRYAAEQDANARSRAYRQARRQEAVAISALARRRAQRLIRKLG